MKRHGFTLFELLIVLALTALLAGLALPRLGASQDRLRLRQAITQVAGHARTARAAAIAGNQTARLRVALVDRQVSVGRGQAYRLPQHLTLQVTTAAGLADAETALFLFYPDGSASGGRIDLISGSARQGIAIDWLTGRIRIDQAVRQ
ncbi:MAG: prepilin-type N-terminal cleavage/methylation domain-containing protein [Rhodothalassiaceae bacterium]